MWEKKDIVFELILQEEMDGRKVDCAQTAETRGPLNVAP
jgi:hypothetical protein